MIKTVTVSIIDAEFNYGVAMSYVGGEQTLEETIEEVKEEAIGNFRDNGGSPACRVIINVNEVPEPKLPGTIIIGILPEGTDDVTITGTITE